MFPISLTAKDFDTLINKVHSFIHSFIIQAEKILNADWLKRAVFILNTCHIWKRVVFQGLEILLSSKYGKCQQDKQDGGQFCRLVCGDVDISMGLAFKVHKKLGIWKANYFCVV